MEVEAMPQAFNVYCDESCHLEHDRQKVMILGATWCPLDEKIAIQYAGSCLVF